MRLSKLILRKILNVEKIVILKILKIGGLIVRERGYVGKPPASKLKRLPPLHLSFQVKKHRRHRRHRQTLKFAAAADAADALKQVKKDFAMEGLSCSTSCYYC